MHGYADLLVDIFRDVKGRVEKPFVVCWLEAPESALRQLRGAGICVIGATERAVDAVAGLVQYGQARARHDGRPLRLPNQTDGLESARAVPVPTITAANLLLEAGIPLAPANIAKDSAEARRVAEQLGYPVAVKIESPDILHKTDVGGVRLGLADGDGAAGAASDVLSEVLGHAPDARIDGVVVQKMMMPVTELVLGVRRDPAFGHVIMVGLGGVFIEVLNDVSFAAAPISAAQASLMLDSLQGRTVLDGARGRPPVNRPALVQMISDLSEFALAHPELVELDLNPVFASGDDIVAVDWLMMVDGKEE